jgi:UDP:flavonoid glycosyltransferase YjiC (YdhE family)
VSRTRVLFVSEAVTLAHVARPVALARALDPARYDVTLALEPRYRGLWDDLDVTVRPITSVTVARFLAALDKGNPLYDLPTLRDYVREDLQVIREADPDVIVGDFRLSLSVSARLAGVPYLALSNAYWSPFALGPLPMPELPLTRRLGVPLARVLFRLASPIAMRLHTAPLNRLRAENGLPPLGDDIRRVYTDADHTLYADPPGLVPTTELPPTHHFLGPILWSPSVPLPDWWGDLPDDRPLVYVTLGSSGGARLLGEALEALEGLPVTAIASTAGRPTPARVPPNARVADYLPGEAASARSALVVCNGGSPTSHQALASGVPVLGLPSNMDQHLNMGHVADRGAGVLLRSEHADRRTIRVAVEKILGDPSFSKSARELSALFAAHSAPDRFRAFLDDAAVPSAHRDPQRMESLH